MRRGLLCRVGLVFFALFLVWTNLVWADPCLVVYPQGPCQYHYDVNEYYTVRPGEPYYDPEFDRGGEVLLELGSNEIDLSIYQAPQLTGFEPSTGGNEGYFFFGTVFDLIVDGYANEPTTFVNVLLIFDGIIPSSCVPDITVEGEEVTGFIYEMGDLVVSTPTPYGNNYSDTVTLNIEWRGCFGVHLWAFADENYNGQRDGGECFTAFSHDTMVPADESTWGAIKAQFE
ncbi:MAG: hypothetical protein JXB45_01145 [Candidatus Krumholzibacteriota bacterium]|nr:hypothetical protein [Candidatus Krumholzibacteriota bacterium]